MTNRTEIIERIRNYIDHAILDHKFSGESQAFAMEELLKELGRIEELTHEDHKMLARLVYDSGILN